MSRLAIFVSVAASLGGALVSAQSEHSFAGSNPASSNFPGAVPLPDDSPAARAFKRSFYNDPHGAAITPAPAPAATVSVEQLRHPVSHRGAKMLSQARNFEDMGRHDLAIAQLQLALEEPSAAPYAHSMLGAEYIKIDQLPLAIAELEQALAVLPRNVPDRSNLGLALFLSGDLEHAEQETRQALELDHRNQTTLRVLHRILHARQMQIPAQAQAHP